MGTRDVIESVDQALGARVERVVVAHHRRRLRKLGHFDALDAPAGGWAGGEPPPRAGNGFEVFVDGSEALPAIVRAVEGARERVWLAGWHFTPAFRMGETTLRELLAEAAERIEVRVLAWAGAPLPLFHPDRREVREMRERLVEGTGIVCALDDRERPMHCHHEKLVIVDGRIAFVGGIDLTTLGGNRFDTPSHPPRGEVGWHDAAARIEGPAVADVAAHFALRWSETTGEELPAANSQQPAGGVELQVVRTVPNNVYDRLPRGDFRILDSYLRTLRSAERLIYLESQFLWSYELVSVLEEKLRNPPVDDFRIVVVLPAHPNNGQEDTRGQLGVLVEADGGAGRFLACTLWQPGEPAHPVYVHAKIGIVDDRWLTLGSANLNEHSFFNDTEVNVVTHDPGVARAVRLRLWSEHLGCDPSELEGDPARIVDERWRPLAQEQLERRRRGEGTTHRLLLLPHVSRRSKGVLGPLNGFFVDG
ncbi:MAG TPA: phosphatidylserine/phosphatidylglycerophosphate/cardiolipin synthase family protein [Gaiellaceae bacterium]|nr:phosphatidylserine/phosphatidylglycerophosphate/cardiolipin synthase family protein [Gaiellaceae bacterium]